MEDTLRQLQLFALCSKALCVEPILSKRHTFATAGFLAYIGCIKRRRRQGERRVVKVCKGLGLASRRGSGNAGRVLVGVLQRS